MGRGVGRRVTRTAPRTQSRPRAAEPRRRGMAGATLTGAPHRVSGVTSSDDDPDLPISRPPSFCAGAWSGRCRSKRATCGPMRVIGEGKDLWRVEVVLWAGEPEASRIGELLNAVAAATVASDEVDPSVLPDVEGVELRHAAARGWSRCGLLGSVRHCWRRRRRGLACCPRGRRDNTRR